MPVFEHLPLASERLVLRPLQAGDEAALFAIFSDALTMRWWSRGPWDRIELAHEMIEKDTRWREEGSALRLGLVLRDQGTLIGAMSLFDFHLHNRRAEIGYILHRAHGGRGYMHEALTAFIDYGVVLLGLNRIEADTDPRNEPSVRALLRLGFEREGLFRERWIIEGQPCDSAMFGLLARDWSARRGGQSPQ
jgi:[ribosomal protein S5]-alanine N-acetyltransferase